MYGFYSGVPGSTADHEESPELVLRNVVHRGAVQRMNGEKVTVCTGDRPLIGCDGHAVPRR